MPAIKPATPPAAPAPEVTLPPAAAAVSPAAPKTASAKKGPVAAKPAAKPAKSAVAATVRPPKQPTAKPAKATKPAKPEKAEKAEKQKKPKLVRDSYTMPENEYDQLAALKKRLLGKGIAAKKSELLRAGLALLAAQTDAALAVQIEKLTPIKTGRPAK